jgi:hypothetical protein
MELNDATFSHPLTTVWVAELTHPVALVGTEATRDVWSSVGYKSLWVRRVRELESL